MRINQYLAGATDLSRRAADAAITAGRVTINGHPAVLGQTVNSSDSLTLDGQPVQPRSTTTSIMLHKPAGYISSRQRQGEAPTVYELLPDNLHHLRIAGRLDQESTGLLILSDDGALIYQLTHPSAGKTKQYELTLSKPLTKPDQSKLAAGVPLPDGPSHVQVLEAAGPNATVSLSEGRNRQLRRTFGALGYGVIRLHRTILGPFKLESLPSGQWKIVSAPGETA